MIVRVNDKEVSIFSGARVQDVLLKYSREQYKAALAGKIEVLDKNRNPVDLEGEITENQRFYLDGTGEAT